MAQRFPARLTKATGRRFGISVGGALIALGVLMWWRDHASAGAVVAGLGTALSIAGVTIPTRLGPIERGWMRLAHAISRVTTPLVMGIVYFMVLTPIALLMRVLGKNPLSRRETEGGFWMPRDIEQGRSGGMDRQF